MFDAVLHPPLLLFLFKHVIFLVTEKYLMQYYTLDLKNITKKLLMPANVGGA